MPKILVVDDDSHIRDVIRFALAREGHTVVEAENGTHGLALTSAEKPDLIVLDIMMPELDGTEVCRRLRASGDRTRSSSYRRATMRSTGFWAWNWAATIMSESRSHPGNWFHG
jgi:CheY-like chemotaxis protein